MLTNLSRSIVKFSQGHFSRSITCSTKAKWSVEEEPNVVLPSVSDIINEDLTHELMESTVEDAKNPLIVKQVLKNARDRALLKHVDDKSEIQSEYVQGLTLEETAILLNVNENDKELMAELYDTALFIKQLIYGNRIVLFAPLYCSNYCIGSCLYCGYRGKNREMKRSYLKDEELVAEVRALEEMGHKRLMMLCGESSKYTFEDFLHHLEVTAAVTAGDHGEIRRINVEIPQLSVSDFKRLKDTEVVGTYVNFMETYHRETYETMHPSCGGTAGMKTDYEDRLTVMDRSLMAGLDDVGIGALYGLYDYRFEVLSMLQHSQWLDSNYGTGPHTISVPRIMPASGSDVSELPPYAVNDEEFKKIVAIIRCMVPYTGIILTTRETKEMRDVLLNLGISQMSAGSKTDVGSYKEGDEEHNDEDQGQFALGDHRPTEEVIYDLISSGFIPSWCTACYRQGRTGPVFMSIAKSGDIQDMCHPNALLTLQEYLLDYATEETREIGYKMIEKEIANVPSKRRQKALRKALEQQENGSRDLFF